MEDQLIRIEEKVLRLVKELGAAQKEIQRLNKENIRLKDELEAKTGQAEQLHQKVDALKINAGNLETGPKKDLEKRINTYLKDIDKCLSLLHT